MFGLTGPALGNALTQLSGEVATGAALSATQMMNAFLSLTLNPYGGSPTGNAGALGYARAFGANEATAMPKEAADAYAANMPAKAAPPAGIAVPGGAWSVWGQGYGGYNRPMATWWWGRITPRHALMALPLVRTIGRAPPPRWALRWPVAS